MVAAEFTYTPFYWKGQHRYVAVRRPAALETDEIQACLFTWQYNYHGLDQAAPFKNGEESVSREPLKFP